MRSKPKFIRIIVFLFIVGTVLTLMSESVPFFKSLSVIAYCGSGLTLLVWLYTLFFGGNDNDTD